SSVFRSSIWGGIPVSLPAMSVFAFLLFWVSHLVLRRRQGDRRATGFLVLATSFLFLVSVGMGFLSLVRLGVTCKLCVGMYIASFVALIGSIGGWINAG